MLSPIVSAANLLRPRSRRHADIFKEREPRLNSLIHYVGCDGFLRCPHIPMGESAVEAHVKAEGNWQIYRSCYKDGK